VQLTATSDSLTKKQSANAYTITTPGGLGAFFFRGIPLDVTINFDVEAKGPVEEFGCFLRGEEKGRDAYRLVFTPQDEDVALAESHIKAVEGLGKKMHISIVAKGDIIDVCIAGKRTIVNRLYEKKGTVLGFFAKHGTVAYSNISINSLN